MEFAYPYIGDYSIEKYCLDDILAGWASQRVPRQALLEIPFNLGTLVLVQGKNPTWTSLLDCSSASPTYQCWSLFMDTDLALNISDVKMCRSPFDLLFGCRNCALRIVNYDNIKCSGLPETVTHV